MHEDDFCYECAGYGDNYGYDDEGELICLCMECPYWDWESDDDEPV